jgi:hypothetical protein
LLAQPGAAWAADDSDGAELLDVLAAVLVEALADSVAAVLPELEEATVAALDDEVDDEAAVFLSLSPPHAPRLTRSSAAVATEVLRQADVLRWLLPPLVTVVPS